MKLARHLERRLEGWIEGLAGRVFRGPIHPMELGARLLREADLAVYPSPAGPATANVYRLIAHPDHLTAMEASVPLEAELARLLEDEAVGRGWRLAGPVSVRFAADSQADPGTVTMMVSVEQGPLETWALLVGHQTIPIRPIRAVVGRSRSADVVISEPEVSRRHALLWREAGRVFVEDLGSANGTFVDGRPLSHDAFPVEGGGLISFGGAQFTFHPA